MPNTIGYARVSTSDQDARMQTDALTEAGAVRIFTETGSGKRNDRPQLAAALDYLNPGDTFMVWSVDRLGRTLLDTARTVERLDAIGAHFACLTAQIDTKSPGGRMVFNLFATMAEYEHALMVQRTREGLAAARRRGRVGGRPSKRTPERVATVHELHEQGKSYSEIARAVGVSRSTITRILNTP